MQDFGNVTKPTTSSSSGGGGFGWHWFLPCLRVLTSIKRREKDNYEKLRLIVYRTATKPCFLRKVRIRKVALRPITYKGDGGVGNWKIHCFLVFTRELEESSETKLSSIICTHETHTGVKKMRGLTVSKIAVTMQASLRRKRRKWRKEWSVTRHEETRTTATFTLFMIWYQSLPFTPFSFSLSLWNKEGRGRTSIF